MNYSIKLKYRGKSLEIIDWLCNNIGKVGIDWILNPVVIVTFDYTTIFTVQFKEETSAMAFKMRFW